MDLKQIEVFCRKAAELNLQKIELKRGDIRLLLIAAAEVTSAFTSAPLSLQKADSLGSNQEGHKIRALTDGVFYRSDVQGGSPAVEVGQTITKGQIVAVVESMKTLFRVEADRAGTVRAILPDDGQVVCAGDTLLVLE
ncbi:MULTISPECIES: acetyl-CoA carboxylase biotin carboxyl carrier protein [Bradyrhizobium]|uniref:Biotin carboxyl carrier protein of acetyl-CoA carboxylase n=3 Tax=Bradyrhizobium TaxID=374 RepID=A0AAE5X9I4_9BRAD|nr:MULTISPECIES: biotin/lipoyl-containing protein [Bradyrhizobium]MCG2629385.1 hypothetical protein [Bradyrhizobium zhengyangense]MCG2644666.1 hypothetical protein [Bradyrhizobium zhengyangense]MCG2670899.1 hypothetical protein [Bradyrhizobium zhengyangense]MDN4984532.1 biotin/lipoyl-containing protein [Bradyrhizobium sp. WYCCWR 13022]MDN5002524.1 biotin/lipoyl-containing protein [Bradyrhizobium sp. WYCCWR 12677]